MTHKSGEVRGKRKRGPQIMTQLEATELVRRRMKESKARNSCGVRGHGWGNSGVHRSFARNGNRHAGVED
jgi:hypothetical protein